MNGSSANTAVLTAKQSTNKRAKTSAWKKYLLTHKTTFGKIGVGLLVLAILIGGALGYTQAYKGKIYPKVIVAGVKVGGLTVEEAKQAVALKAQELNAHGPEITFNSQRLLPELDEMGVTFNLDEVVNQAYRFGRKGNIFQQLSENFQLATKSYRVEIQPQINEEKFNDYLGQLAHVAEKEPVNATLIIKNGQILLSPSEKGRGLDKEKLKDDLTGFINSGQKNAAGQISMVTSDLEPMVVEAETTEARSQAEKWLAAAPITVIFENLAWTADRAQIGTWIEFRPSEHRLLSSVDPSGFVNWIAKQIEIPMKDREIEDGTGTVLDEGQDGRGVETNTLKKQIADALGGGKPNASFALGTFTIPRGETIIYPHAQPGRYQGRYIDINLSEQTLYAFEDSNQVNSFLVSTGRRGYSTPTGEFHIYGKDRYSLMDGEDYYLPNVPFVSWFYGDYSIHGTYWHSNFGQVMSHGCVNASIGDAEWIFGWADIGTPVYIHY